jgi:diacylglycerol kinase family enzyme
MLFQAGQRSVARSFPEPAPRFARRPRVAVILNERARGVRPSVVRTLEQIVPASDLYLSRSLPESRRIARSVVEQGYESVLLGGGDGTFVQCLADLAGEARRSRTPLPGVGVLRLGTGNALADALGASSPTLDGLAADVRKARRRAQKTLPLLSVDGKLTPFAGCGLDAQILDDFGKLGRTIDRVAGPLAPRIGAAARYALTVGLRSTPRFVLSQLPEIEVVNTGGPAWRVDWRTGRVIDDEPLAQGQVLFRGRASLASCSTIPYFGLKMKVFPYVDAVPGRFQLRCATASAFETLRNLPAVFRGEYRSNNLHDYLCESVEIRMERPVPVQVGGDLVDELRDRLPISLAPDRIRVVS